MNSFCTNEGLPPTPSPAIAISAKASPISPIISRKSTPQATSFTQLDPMHCILQFSLCQMWHFKWTTSKLRIAAAASDVAATPATSTSDAAAATPTCNWNNCNWQKVQRTAALRPKSEHWKPKTKQKKHIRKSREQRATSRQWVHGQWQNGK